MKLQTRMQEVMKSDWNRFDITLRHFFERVRKMPPLATILDELNGAVSQECVDHARAAAGNPRATLPEPTDEVERASFFYALCSEVVKSGVSQNIHLMRTLCPGERQAGQMVSSFKEQVFFPLYSYLDERLDDGDLVLSILCRYAALVEWFLQDELRIVCGSPKEASAWKEEPLDRHLRRFLVEQGIPYPFSQPDTPEGRADIVIAGTDQPLPIEVKVFDGKQRNKTYIEKGVGQAVQYAVDYQTPFGYLVVYNVTPETLTIGESSGENVARLSDRNKDVFCVVVQVERLGAPSKRKTKSVSVSIEESTEDIDEELEI